MIIVNKNTKPGDVRVKTRFAYIPVTCKSSENCTSTETRWAETVTTKQKYTITGHEEESASGQWIDLYFIDNDINNKAH